MNKVLVIVTCLLPIFAKAQTTDTIVLLGEYQMGIRFGTTFKTGGGGSTGQGSSMLISNKGKLGNIAFNDGHSRQVIGGCSGLHTMLILTPGSGGSYTGDTLWMTGLNDGHIQGSSTAPAQNNFVPILLDHSGNPFTNIVGVWMSATAGLIDTTAFAYAWKTDGTLWRIGNSTGGLTGDGTTGNSAHVDSFFVQVPNPSGGWFVDNVVGMFFPMVHDTTNGGTAWTFGNQNYIGYALGQGGDYRTPGKIVLTGGHKAIKIASNSLASYVIDERGHLWGWSFYSALLGINVHWSGTTQMTSPTDLTTSQATGLTYLNVACIEETTSAIMSDSTLRTWGDNPEGTAGVPGDAGYQINMYNTTPVPFNYDGNHGENIVPLPLNPFAYTTPACTNLKIKHIFSGGYYQRDQWVCDFQGRWYHLGRNKNAVGLFYVNGDATFNQEAYYPDWADDSIAQQRNIVGTTETYAECPYCTLHPAATDCHSLYTPPGEANPTVSAGSNQNINVTTATLSGSATPASGHTINQYQWSGPCGVLFSNNFTANPTVSGLSVGANVLTLTATDDADKSNTSTVTVTVIAQTGYYWNTATGNDANPCTAAQPCQTKTSFNAITWFPGDTAYFERGQTFPGDFLVSASGVAGNPIVLTSYGTGNEPIIGGMTTLSGWTNTSGNLWQTAVPGPTPMLLAINKVLAGKATTPNRTTGYYIPTAMGSNTITDAAHAGAAPIGDTIIGRSSAYTLDQAVVTGNASGVLTVTPNFTYSGVGGLGWLVIGNTPDSVTEWNLITGNYVQVYSVGSPANYTVPTSGLPLTISGNYVVVNGLHISGSDTANVLLTGSNCKLLADSIDYGYDGIQMNSSVSDSVVNCYIAHMGDNGILKENTSNYNLYLVGNFVYDIGMITGMGRSGNTYQTYCGFVAGDSGSVVKLNTFDSIGYIPIAIYGSGFKADSNYIINFCWLKADGAAIYTWLGSATTFAQWREVKANIAVNGGGPMVLNGTTLTSSAEASLAYADNYSGQLNVTYNTASNINGPAFFDHGPNNLWEHNTALGSGYADFLASEVGPVITNLVVKYNNFGSGTGALRLATINNDLATFGAVDSNYIAGTTGVTTPYWTYASGGGDPGTYRTPTVWNATTGYDAHSTFQTGTLLLVLNPYNATNVYYVPGTYKNGTGYVFNTVSLSPYNSALLLLQSYGQRFRGWKVSSMQHP